MEINKKKDSLKKLKMPMKGKDPMLELDEGDTSLDMPEEMPPSEGEESEAMPGEESMEEEAQELQELDDQLLIDEMEKRGFKVERLDEEMAEGESEPIEPDSGDEMY